MSKPLRHAISSAKIFGGVPEDYIKIHDFMDSSKGVVADNRHRALTHQAWFIAPQGPLERSFGAEILIPREDKESAFLEAQAEIDQLERDILRLKMRQRTVARVVAVRDIGEQHILEDFQGRFIPTAGDYLSGVPFEAWMDNGAKGTPPSAEGLFKNVRTRTIRLGD